MGKRRREQLNADAQKLQVQRLGELVDQKDALLLSDLPAQYQAAFDQPLRTESKLRKYLEGLDGFELCEGDKPGTHCLRRKVDQPQKTARRDVRTTAENVISVESAPQPQSEFNPVRRAATPPEPLSTGAPKTTTSTSDDGSSSFVSALPKTFASHLGQQLFAALSKVRKASSRAARSVEDGATTSRNARISSCNFWSGDAALLTGLNSDCGCGADSTLMTFSAVVRTSRRAFFCG